MNRLTIKAYKPIIGCIILVALLNACKHKTYKLDPPVSPFIKSLVEKKITGTNYFISLPANYLIKERRGPDFSVYYFYPSDTLDKTAFYGGFYLGNAPGGFGPDNDSCKEEKITSFLLGDNKEWTMYDCNNKYKVQLITDSKSGYDWAIYIHAFGRGSSKIELNKLLEVYSTLKKK